MILEISGKMILNEDEEKMSGRIKKFYLSPSLTDPFKTSLLLMGLSGIVAQVILLRELLVSFFGNELTFGIILANWLILEAAGSFLVGKTVERAIKKIEIYVFFQLIFSLALPLSIFLARVFKNILFPIPGEAVGFVPVFYASFLILLPVAIPHGALFTYGCKIYSHPDKNDAASIGKVYVLETLGSIAGGLFIAFLLIQYFTSFEIAFAVSLTNALISLFLLWPGKVSPLWGLRSLLRGSSLILSFLFAFLLFSAAGKELDHFSIRTQWKGLQVIHYQNSVYGNITVTQKGEQFTFFTDGIPSITTPVPDIASIEDFVHFPMLYHENPERILILSGGAGGVIREVLKYPVTAVDYVELDPLLLQLIKKFPTALTQEELADPRVKIHYTDGRFFTKKTAVCYDIIFIGLSAPHELQSNRLFSAEFFSLARRKLNPGGILVFTLPGSLTYISPELKDLNGCIRETLKGVFRKVKTVPGDVNLYLASDSEKLEFLSAGDLSRRLAERKVKTQLFTEAYIEYRLHERWGIWFARSMEGKEFQPNADFRPVGVYFNLAYWNSYFSPRLTAVLRWLQGLSFSHMIVPMAIGPVLLALAFRRRPSTLRNALPYAIFTSGLAGMIFDLAIIFSFQTVFGFLYHQIGLLVTLFMMGVALSSLYVVKNLGAIKNPERLFLVTEFWIVLFALLLPLVFSLPAPHLEKPSVYILLYAGFLIMSFLCGVLVGLEFPLASKIYLSHPAGAVNLSHTAGLLYGADLLGGFFGGLFGGFLLLPVLGLSGTCLLLAVLKAGSFFFFLLFTRRPK